jgi:acetyl esterase/lipase
VAEISRLTNSIVVAPDYPLAPENVFPAALESVARVLDAIRETHPDLPLTLMGDSAGGGLAVAAAIQGGGELKASLRAIVALSPWFDLTCTSPRYAEGAIHDGSLNPRRLQAFARMYRGAAAATHPLISPIFATLDALPPMLIQVGRDEILYEEALGFANKLKASGGRVTFEAFDDVVHVWQWYWPILGTGRTALNRIARFLNTLEERNAGAA